jgi:ribosomal protein L37E
MEGLLIWIGIAALGAGAIIYTVVVIRRKIAMVSTLLFGTSSLREGIRNRELEVAQTPKSVSSAQSLYGPLVQRDFPELNLEELKALVEKSITEIFMAIENRNDKAYQDVPKVNAWICSKIEDNKEPVHYDELRFHTTVLNRYLKNNDHAILRFQSAFEYVLRKASKATKIQDRLEIEYVYALNEEALHGKASESLNCRNCGAPVTNLGDKFCEYCGAGIVRLVKKVWMLNNIKQI